MATVFNGDNSDIPMLAAADYSAKQYYCMQFNTTANQFELCNAAGERVDGILQDKPNAAGKVGVIRKSGTSRVVAGAAFNRGVQLKTDANGKAVEASAAIVVTNDGGSATDPVVGSFIIGTALDASSGDGAIVGVDLHLGGAIPTTAA